LAYSGEKILEEISKGEKERGRVLQVQRSLNFETKMALSDDIIHSIKLI
jgi:hypothetical protein